MGSGPRCLRFKQLTRGVWLSVTRLVQGRVIRHGREQNEIPAGSPHHLRPEVTLRENILRIEVRDDPRITLDLGLELAGTPAGMTYENPGP